MRAIGDDPEERGTDCDDCIVGAVIALDDGGIGGVEELEPCVTVRLLDDNTNEEVCDDGCTGTNRVTEESTAVEEEEASDVVSGISLSTMQEVAITIRHNDKTEGFK